MLTKYSKEDVGMTKADLIASIATDAGIKKSVAEKVVDSFIDNVEKALKNGEKVTLTGFGTFQCTERAARTGRNPRTGKEIKIDSCNIPKFKPGSKLKEALK
jgi:DNA-binding protein HU-beta